MDKYGPEIRLRENQLYTMTVTIRGKEKVLSFTSAYNPLFASVRMVRSDYRTLFETYKDDHINQLIHDNSKLAMEISQVDIDPESDEGVPFVARQFVRYKTELDLATDLFLFMTSRGGQHDKQIGDMRIMSQVQAPAIKPILDILRQKTEAWETQLVGMKGASSSAVRAGGNVYPLEGRVGF